MRVGATARRLAGVTVVAALVLSGCASASTSQETASEPASAGNTPASSGSSSGPVDAGMVAEHVHNLALDGTDIFLGTHEGLFRQAPGQPLEQVSEQPFDVMGLTRSGALWLASGHPGEGIDAPGNLGLITSSDGVSWQARSLSGEVDFHRLAASGDTVLGLSAHDGALLASSDGGATWSDLGQPPLFDVAVSPQDAAVVVGTTPDGPVISNDGGATFSPIAGAPLIALLAWDGQNLYGVDPAGTVMVSADNGQTWTERGSVPGRPAALAAEAGNVALLSNGVVQFSTDGGLAFAPRITGLAGH